MYRIYCDGDLWRQLANYGEAIDYAGRMVRRGLCNRVRVERGGQLIYSA